MMCGGNWGLLLLFVLFDMALSLHHTHDFASPDAPHTAVGAYFLKQGDMRKAESAFQAAVMFARSPSTLIDLGKCQMMDDRLASAEGHMLDAWKMAVAADNRSHMRLAIEQLDKLEARIIEIGASARSGNKPLQDDELTTGNGATDYGPKWRRRVLESVEEPPPLGTYVMPRHDQIRYEWEDYMDPTEKEET